VIFAAVIAGLLVVIGIATTYLAPALPVRVAYKPEPRVQSLYLDAVYSLGTRQANGFLHAMRLLTEATTLDPNYADAYARLADAYNMISQYTLMPAGEAYPRALAAANRAIALEPDNAGAYAALAFTTFYWTKDFEKSRRLFEQAIDLDPDAAQTHHWYALTLMVTGETAIPLREISRAQELNPESRAIIANKALILFHAGQAEEALTILEQLSGAEPNLRSPHEYLATVYLDEGRLTDFLREYRASAEISEIMRAWRLRTLPRKACVPRAARAFSRRCSTNRSASSRRIWNRPTRSRPLPRCSAASTMPFATSRNRSGGAKATH
jgi:tetratricopeptide (TPR) repeat protein